MGDVQEAQLAEPSTTKDRNKDGFLARNISKLPESIRAQYGKANRRDKRSLVNEIVQRLPDGSWGFNMDAKVVSEWQERFSEHSVQKGLVTKPPGRAATMWGGWGSS